MDAIELIAQLAVVMEKMDFYGFSIEFIENPQL